jgi:hypothetical protein
MRATFNSKGGFTNALKWMEETKHIPSAMIVQTAQYGKTHLTQATPEDTGETALGWDYKVSETPTGVEIAWVNNAHPESEVNVAMLIELGHGTRTGGYVAPKPYIKQAMTPVWSKVNRDIEELMK